MGNLAELFISLTLASGQWAGPIQQGSTLEANASGMPGDGAISSIPPEPEPRLACSVHVLFPPQPASGWSPAIRSMTDGPTEGRESTFDGRQEPIPPSAKSLGLSPGDRVRFSTAEERPVTEGNLVAADPEALLLKLPGVDEPVRIPWSSLRRLEAYRGQHSLAGRGAKIGAWTVGIPFAIVAFFAAGLGNLDCEARCNGWPEFAGAAFVGGAAGAGIGGVAGALIGSLYRTERWDKVDLPAIRVSVTPQRGGGLAVALSLRF